MDSGINSELTSLFNKYLATYVEDAYQKQLFQFAWDEFIADNNANTFLHEINLLLNNHIHKYDPDSLNRVRFILTIIEIVMQLLNKLNQKKLTNDWQNINKNLILLTAYTFVGTFPQLLITDSNLSKNLQIQASKILVDFLAEQVFIFGSKQPKDTISGRKLYSELAQVLIY